MRLRSVIQLSTLAACLLVAAQTASADDYGLAHLSSTNPATVIHAIRSLKTDPFPTEAVPVLLKLIDDKNQSIRIAAMGFWGDHASDAYSEMIEVGLADEPGFVDIKNLLPETIEQQAKSRDEKTRRAAIRAICAAAMNAAWICPMHRRCGDTDGIDRTFFYDLCSHAKEWTTETDSLIDDSNPNVVYSALEITSIRGGTSSIESRAIQSKVAKMLRSENKYFRALGANFIQPKSQAEAIRIFEPLLSDHDPDVADSAQWAALDKINIDTLVDRFDGLSAKLRALLAREIGYHISEPSLDPAKCEHLVRQLLTDEDPDVSAYAMAAARALKVEFSEAELRSFLMSDVGSLRDNALEDLLAKNVPDSKELAARGCSDPDEDVRSGAVKFAVGIDDPSLARPILKAVELGLGNNSYLAEPFFLRPANEVYLDRMIRSNNPNDRLLAAQAMFGNEKYLDKLLAMSRDQDPDVLECVANALSESQGQSAIDAIESLAQKAKGELLESALGDLGNMNQIGVIPFIREYLNNPDRAVRRRAKSAIKYLEGLSVHPAL